MNITVPNWTYLIIMLGILLASGAGEYLKLAPQGSFYTILVLVIGLIAPSPAFPHAQVNTPQATINTSVTEVQEGKSG